jgi:hypothetical protein
VFLISKDGGSRQAVTPEEGRETDPTRPPDGNTLAFGHRRLTAEVAFIELFNLTVVLKGDNRYLRLRVSDSILEKVADLKKVRQFRGQFGPVSWTGLAPGEIPLVPRDISTQEIYAFDLQLP